jgi:hypothetical protein
MSPISQATVNALIQPNPGGADQQRDVAVLGALAPELHGQRGDLQLEVIDEPQADLDVPAPRIGDLQTVQQLAAGVPEQIRDRARVPEGDQRGVDAVLQRRAVPDQVQPEARQLALAADARVGQPDLGDQVARRQRGQYARVDLVGLARQRGQALTLVASAISTSQPCSSSRSCTNRAPFIDSITPRTAGAHIAALAAKPRRPSASGGDAHSSTISPADDNRQTSTLRRLKSNPACNMNTGLLGLASR